MSSLEKTWLAMVKDSTWTMALLETTSSKMTVTAFREFNMPFFQDPDFDVAAIKEWMDRFATGPSRLKIAMDSAAILTDFVDFPRVSGKTLERHFKDNVSNYFDCNKDDYVVNFKVAGFFKQNGLERVRILLAALPKDLLTRIYQIVGHLGIELSSLNIACECFMRLFEEMDPQRSWNMVVVSLDSVVGHVFLVEKGEVVSYATVDVALNQLFRALRELEKFPSSKGFPLGGETPLKRVIGRPLGFEKAEEDAALQSGGHLTQGGQRTRGLWRSEKPLLTDAIDLFPEFAVITPKIEEIDLASLFISYQDLPFSLTLTALDLQRLRKKEASAMDGQTLAQKGAGRESELDSLFSDGGQRASLKRVADKIKELIQMYQKDQPTESFPLDENDQYVESSYLPIPAGLSDRKSQNFGDGLVEHNSIFRELYVTGIGTEASYFAILLKEIWQDVLPVYCGFLKQWQNPVIQRQQDPVDWTRHPCLLGLILKTYDELN